MKTFFAVYAYSYAKDDFVIDGIYTRKDDADAHLVEFKAANPKVHCVVGEDTFEAIVERLTSARLGVIADLLREKMT